MNNVPFSIARTEKRGGGVSLFIDSMTEQTRENLKRCGISIEVYSAIRDALLNFNATDELILLSDLLNSGETSKARKKSEEIHFKTVEIIKKHYAGYDSDEGIQEFIDNEFQGLFNAIDSYSGTHELSEENDYSVGDFSIMGFGEIFRAKLQVYLLGQEGINAVYLDPEEMETEAQDLGDVLSFYKSQVLRILEENNGEELALVVPGFIRKLKGGINGMIGRGFTDTITGLVSLALLDTQQFEWVVFELQKDVPGLMSTNPNDLENGFERTNLLNEVSIRLAKMVFGEEGANSQLLNGKTLNEYIIAALEKHDNYSVELRNPQSKDGRKTIIKKEVKVISGKVQILASRDDIPNRHRLGLGIGGVNSLYVLGENIELFQNDLITRVSDSLRKISGITYHIQDGNMLVINFSGDYDPRSDRSLTDEEKEHKYNEIIAVKREIVTEQEKQKKALDILHRDLIEDEDKQQKIAEGG